MKPLLALALLLCCLAAHAKGKAKIKIDTTPNPTENVWTITNELNYYHDTAQQMQDTLYNNVTIDYTAKNGWDIQFASYNIALTGGGAQNYQTDTYLNVSKTFNITHDFQAIIGSQNGTTIPHSLNPRQLHNADYSLVVYQPDAQLNLHVGPYWVNKALATTTDFLGYTGGFSIEVIPKLLIFQFTHMHFRTHTKPENVGQAGRWQSYYHDAMIDHDKNVGTVLDKIDSLGIADNTIVMYSTDNGPHMNSWPDAGMTPFRSEKNTNWEGAYRVPAMVRWPGHIKPNSVSNDIVSHLDWAPTLLAAAGVPDVKEKLLKGYKAGGKTYKVHLDGYNQLPYLTGQAPKSPREEFFYFSDDGDLTALRYDNWKIVFAQQRAAGTMLVWGEPFVKTRIPWLFNLRTDPYEKASITSNTYWDWYLDHVFLLTPAQKHVGAYLATFKEFPPRQKAASFSIDQVLEQLQTPADK